MAARLGTENVVATTVRLDAAIERSPSATTNHYQSKLFQRAKSFAPFKVSSFENIHMTKPVQRRVLLVEDEPLVSMLIADMLDELGYEVIKAGPDVEAASDAARTESIQMAVLDLAIEDGSTFPVAAILRERGVPFIFITGLDISRAREKFGATVVLEKPFGAAALDTALGMAERKRAAS